LVALLSGQIIQPVNQAANYQATILIFFLSHHRHA